MRRDFGGSIYWGELAETCGDIFRVVGLRGVARFPGNIYVHGIQLHYSGLKNGVQIVVNHNCQAPHYIGNCRGLSARQLIPCNISFCFCTWGRVHQAAGLLFVMYKAMRHAPTNVCVWVWVRVQVKRLRITVLRPWIIRGRTAIPQVSQKRTDIKGALSCDAPEAKTGSHVHNSSSHCDSDYFTSIFHDNKK